MNTTARRTHRSLLLFTCLVAAAACGSDHDPDAVELGSTQGALSASVGDAGDAGTTAPVTVAAKTIVDGLRTLQCADDASAAVARLYAATAPAPIGTPLGAAALAPPPITQAVLEPSAAPTIDIVGGAFVPAYAGSTPSLVDVKYQPGAAFTVRDRKSDMEIAVAMKGAAQVLPQTSDGYVVYADAAATGRHVVHRPVRGGTQDWTALAPGQSKLTYELQLTRGVAGLRVAGSSVEVLDEKGFPRLRMSAPLVVDRSCGKTSVRVTLRGCAFDTSPKVPWGRPVTPPRSTSCQVDMTWDPNNVGDGAWLDPTWTGAADMGFARANHVSALLASPAGIFVAGGLMSTASTSPEFFNFQQLAWTTLGGSVPVFNGSSIAVLGTSRVLVAGGYDGNGAAVKSYTVYDVSTGAVVHQGEMGTARGSFTLTALANGTVLAAGGDNTWLPANRMTGATYLNTTELYDPALDTWTAKASMPHARSNHAAIGSGNVVMIVGGYNASEGSLAATDYYSANTWGSLGSLGTARSRHTATVLANGNVLVAGGVGATEATVASTEVFNATTYAWTSGGALSHPRWFHRAGLFSNGTAMVVGGLDSADFKKTELFTTTPSWIDSTNLNTGRLLPGLETLGTLALITGGIDSSYAIRKTTEIFDLQDSDGDQLADPWELQYAGNLTTLTGLTQDADADGLSNEAEYAKGTNPVVSDTDGDDMPDGWEVTNGLAPTVSDGFEDKDGDRYPNVFEYARGSNANDLQSKPTPNIVVNAAGGAGTYTTVSGAVAVASTANGAYQIIGIAPGVYTGSSNDVDLPTTKPKFLIIGVEGAANTILDGGGNTWGWQVFNKAVISSLTFRHWYQAIAVNTSGQEVRLVDLIVRDNANPSSGAGLAVSGSSKAYVVGSNFIDNVGVSGVGQIHVSNATGTILNTVVWAQGTGVSLTTYGTTTLVTNNCLAKGQTLTGTGNLAGNVDPKFQSDLRLRFDSPLRGAGGTVAQSRIDIDGELRPSTSPDIGVDQFNDSDNDGLPDIWEIATFGNTTTLSGTADDDSDGLTNAQEHAWETNRLDPDTDRDGVRDGVEVAIGTNPLVADADDLASDLNHDGLIDSIGAQLGYQPTQSDSDGDSVSNADEALMCTNPLRTDSDGDGVPDSTDAFPLDPLRSALSTPSQDVTPPVITLTSPWYAVEQ